MFCNFSAGRKLQSVEEFQELMASRVKKIKDICDHKGQGSRISSDNFKNFLQLQEGNPKNSVSQKLPSSA
jgi:hypothetical protein